MDIAVHSSEEFTDVGSRVSRRLLVVGVGLFVLLVLVMLAISVAARGVLATAPEAVLQVAVAVAAVKFFRRLRAALISSHHRYEDLFAHAPIALWEFDISGARRWLDGGDPATAQPGPIARDERIIDEALEKVRLTAVNRAAQSLLAEAPSPRLLGSPLEQIAGRQLWRALEEGARTPFAVSAVVPDGANFQGIGRWALRLDPAGRSGDAAILAISDVTALKQKESELEDALQARNSLIATVSHELRTPLTSVLGYASLLASNSPDVDPAEIARIISGQAIEVTSLIEDLLVFTRLSEGRLPIESTAVDLQAEAARAVELCVSSHPEAADRITVSSTAATSTADPLRVRQIVRNLVQNAIRYGGPNIRVEAHTVSGRPVVSVIDDGPGVDAESSQLIFEAYATAVDEDHASGGTGLGLTVSRSLAQLMGGDVTYRRLEGATVFELEVSPVEVAA